MPQTCLLVKKINWEIKRKTECQAAQAEQGHSPKRVIKPSPQYYSGLDYD